MSDFCVPSAQPGAWQSALDLKRHFQGSCKTDLVPTADSTTRPHPSTLAQGHALHWRPCVSVIEYLQQPLSWKLLLPGLLRGWGFETVTEGLRTHPVTGLGCKQAPTLATTSSACPPTSHHPLASVSLSVISEPTNFDTAPEHGGVSCAQGHSLGAGLCPKHSSDHLRCVCTSMPDALRTSQSR